MLFVCLMVIWVFLLFLFKKFLIEIFVLFLVSDKLFFDNIILIFVKIGIVVLEEIVCWIVCNFCKKIFCLIVNFIM